MDKRIVGLYKDYNSVIKPLIAEVEARTEQFPLPLFNEIRALHDHISRCYSEEATNDSIEEEVVKAQRHSLRIMLDCYKYLNLTLHDEVILFERETKHIDLTVLQNGTFYPKYKEMRSNAIKLVRQAKSEESLDSVKALDTYQLSYNAYTEIETLIDSVYTDVHWARVRFSVRRGLRIFLWLLSAILSGVISILLAKFFLFTQ